MTMLELHRSRFVEWQPSAVVALAVAPGGATVALARETGDIEVYDTTDWRCSARIPGHTGAAVSALAWCAPFDFDAEEDDVSGGVPCVLLSAGLDGQITEWDLNTLRPRSVTDSHGGSVWCLCAEPKPKPGQPQRVAVACDDGAVRFIVVMAGEGVGRGVQHRRGFGAVGGRCLSLAWLGSGVNIAVGTSKAHIHVWDVANSREIERITVEGRDKLNKYGKEGDELCVWALDYLPDGTLVSGSSEGDVTFWDGQFGTKLYTFKQHKADVLAVTSSPDGKFVYASGIDSQVAQFERIEEENNTWAYTVCKRPHTHDVKAMAMASGPAGSVLLTGGNDAQLLAYPAHAFRKRHPVRVVSVPQRTPLALTGPGTWTGPSKSAGKKGRKGGSDANGKHERMEVKPQVGHPDPPLLLCDHSRWVDVWRLGEGLHGGPGGATNEAVDSTKGHDGMMKLAAAPTHVVRAKLGGSRRTLCSAISPDGKFIAVSDTHALRLFQLVLNEENGEYRIEKQDTPKGVKAAHQLVFTPDGKVLVAVGASGTVHVIDLQAREATTRLTAHVPKVSSAAIALERAAKSGVKRKSGDEGAEPVANKGVVSVEDIGCPPVSHVCCSADNQWLAVVTTKGHRRVAGVHVYSLDNLKLHATLPAPPGHAYWPPVSAMSLSASGILALAVRDNGVLTYDVESKELTPWSSALAAAGMSAPREMASLPGQICNLSFDPTPGSSVLLAQTPSAIARMNLGKPPVVDAPAPSKKRRKKERERGPGGHGGGDGKSELQPRGGNPGQGGGGDVKVATLDNPCLLLSYFAPRQALLVERPWEEVLEQMPAPLYRHKFGT